MKALAVILAAIVVALLVAARADGGVATMSRDTQAWLERVLHADLPDRPVSPAGPAPCGDDGLCVLATAFPERITLSDEVWVALMAIERDGWDDTGLSLALIHEHLHPDVPVPPQHMWLEEAVVEALARDLYVPWLHRQGAVTLWWPGMPGAYQQGVTFVRVASARAVGGSWRSRAARLWRRDVWRMGHEERARVVTEAYLRGRAT